MHQNVVRNWIWRGHKHITFEEIRKAFGTMIRETIHKDSDGINVKSLMARVQTEKIDEIL